MTSNPGVLVHEARPTPALADAGGSASVECPEAEDSGYWAVPGTQSWEMTE